MPRLVVPIAPVGAAPRAGASTSGWYGRIRRARGRRRTSRPSSCSPAPRARRSRATSTPGSTDHALRHHAARVRAEDAARDEPHDELLVADDQRVAGVGAAGVAHHQVGALGVDVDDLALALVAPLCADDHDRGHSEAPLASRGLASARSSLRAASVNPPGSRSPLPQARLPSERLLRRPDVLPPSSARSPGPPRRRRAPPGTPRPRSSRPRRRRMLAPRPPAPPSRSRTRWENRQDSRVPLADPGPARAQRPRAHQPPQRRRERRGALRPRSDEHPQRRLVRCARGLARPGDRVEVPGRSRRPASAGRSGRADVVAAARRDRAPRAIARAHGRSHPCSTRSPRSSPRSTRSAGAEPGLARAASQSARSSASGASAGVPVRRRVAPCEDRGAVQVRRAAAREVRQRGDGRDDARAMDVGGLPAREHGGEPRGVLLLRAPRRARRRARPARRRAASARWIAWPRSIDERAREAEPLAPRRRRASGSPGSPASVAGSSGAARGTAPYSSTPACGICRCLPRAARRRRTTVPS